MNRLTGKICSAASLDGCPVACSTLASSRLITTTFCCNLPLFFGMSTLQYRNATRLSNTPVTDCTGNLCIRCCADENCVAHRELRAKARWKEEVMEGTTEIQRKAKHKRSRAIPKGRFKEKAFKYMNDTVVLWDLRTVLDPSLQQQHPSSMDRAKDKRGSTTTTTVTNSNSTFAASVSSADIVQHQNDLKIKDEILRRSRKNNQSSLAVKTKLRRNYQGTRKRLRNVMETLYQKSLD